MIVYYVLVYTLFVYMLGFALGYYMQAIKTQLANRNARLVWQQTKSAFLKKRGS